MWLARLLLFLRCARPPTSSWPVRSPQPGRATAPGAVACPAQSRVQPAPPHSAPGALASPPPSAEKESEGHGTWRPGCPCALALHTCEDPASLLPGPHTGPHGLLLLSMGVEGRGGALLWVCRPGPPLRGYLGCRNTLTWSKAAGSHPLSPLALGKVAGERRSETSGRGHCCSLCLLPAVCTFSLLPRH